ncbi:MAG TPA: hypothetical protein PLX71_08745 [Phycicoccus sp.]|nr:hypothetical protein [Phycicoccus sp.]
MNEHVEAETTGISGSAADSFTRTDRAPITDQLTGLSGAAVLLPVDRLSATVRPPLWSLDEQP